MPSVTSIWGLWTAGNQAESVGNGEKRRKDLHTCRSKWPVRAEREVCFGSRSMRWGCKAVLETP